MSVSTAIHPQRTRRTTQIPESPLRRVQGLFELNNTDLGGIFGTSRQAVSTWLSRGVPPARQPKVYTVLNVAELLERRLKPGRVPAVVRRRAAAYDGLSMLQMIKADRHEELLESIRESFDWSATT